MSYRIGQLILTPASKNNTISEVFVAQPDSDKEALAGKIFVLLEIETKRSDGLKLANFLINHINNSYYQNEKLILKEKIPSLRIEHIFESVVSRANKKIIEFIKEEKIKISSNSLNSTVGLIYNNEIHFSTAGKNKAILIYKKTFNNNSSYKTIDLNKNNSEDKETSNGKLFTNVISGVIPDGAIFVFSNEALPEYLSPKQLSDITTTLPPTSAVEQIKNTLSQINEYISFIGIIIKSSKLNSEETKAATEKPLAINESISKLNHTERSTETILSPSGSFKINSYIKDVFSKISIFLSKKDKNNSIFLKSNINLKSRASKFYFNKILIFIKSLYENTINIIFYILKSFGSSENIRKSISSIKLFFVNLFNSGKNISLKLKGKYKFIIIIFIISVFGIFYEINKSKNEKIEENKRIKYQQITTSIEQKQNQAEANLLYNNEDGAKELFIEIKNLLSEFPQETDEQKKAYNEFSLKLNEQLDKVRKVIEIKNTDPLIDFSEINKNSKVESIVLLDGTIYGSDPDQNSIYIFNTESRLTTTVTDLNNKLNNIKYPTVNDAQTIYWYSGDTITKLQADTEEVFSLTLEKDPNTNIVAMNSYNQRVYMVDTNNSDIIRYEKGDTGLLKYTKWLNRDADLSKTVSMDIDGFIYTLDSDGTIHKFLTGDEENLVQDLVEPPVNTATKIVVSKDNDYIYVLDSENSRIIIYLKSGKFIEQLESKTLSRIDDIIVDELNKAIYILADNKIFNIPITHID